MGNRRSYAREVTGEISPPALKTSPDTVTSDRSVHRTLYTVHCTVSYVYVQFTVYNVQCPMFMYSLQCTMYSVLCLCTVYSAQCLYVHCTATFLRDTLLPHSGFSTNKTHQSDASALVVKVIY